MGVFLCKSVSGALCRGFCTASSTERKIKEKKKKTSNNFGSKMPITGFLFLVSSRKAVNSTGIIRPAGLLRQGDECSFVRVG
jgi:hypothetical protein